MTTQQEFRVVSLSWPEADYEVRAVGDGMEFTGYAAVFNSQSEDLGGFRETLLPGAFTRSINAAANGAADIRMFWNHDSGRPLGSSKANLRLAQDDTGLVATATFPETTDGRDMSELIHKKIVRSMSFGFNVPRKAPDGGPAEEWSADRKERTLRHVTLHEVSPVTGWPAYGATSASVRHLLAMVDWSEEDSLREFVDNFTDEQRDILHRLLNREREVPFISPDMADLQARFAARLEHAKARGVLLPD